MERAMNLLKRSRANAAEKGQKGARNSGRKNVETLNELRLAIADREQPPRKSGKRNVSRWQRRHRLVELVPARRDRYPSYESKLATQSAGESRCGKLRFKNKRRRLLEAEAAATRFTSQRAARVSAVEKRETELEASNRLRRGRKRNAVTRQPRVAIEMQIEPGRNISRRYQLTFARLVGENGIRQDVAGRN